MIRRHALPSLAALALVCGGPQAARFEAIHAPRVVLMLVLAAALMARGRLERRAFGSVEGLALACLAAMGLSAALATSPAYALEPLALAAAATAVLLGAAREDRELWLRWLCGAVLAVAVFGLFEALGLGPASLPGRAPSATMGQRNALAHLLLLGCPLVWVTLRHRAALIAATLLLAAVIVATRSRAAWVMAGPVLLCFAALNRRDALPLIAAAVSGVAAAALAPVAVAWKSAHPYADSLGRLFEYGSGSGAGRLAEWKASLALFAERPVLGVGPGNWFVEYGLEHGGSHFAHSDWVGFLVERGALGVVLLLALAVALLRRSTQRAMLVPTLLAAAGLGALDSVLQLPAPLLLVSCVAFVGVGPREPVARAPIAAGAFAMIALAAVLTATSLGLSTAASAPLDRLELAAQLNPLDGELRFTLAEAWASAGHCERAQPHVDALRRLLPRHPKLGALQAHCGQR